VYSGTSSTGNNYIYESIVIIFPSGVSLTLLLVILLRYEVEGMKVYIGVGVGVPTSRYRLEQERKGNSRCLNGNSMNRVSPALWQYTRDQTRL
jgi:hypothetical protein